MISIIIFLHFPHDGVCSNMFRHSQNKVKKVSFNFLQTIYNSNLEKICEAEVFCGSISSASKKPTLVPKKLLNNMIKEIS